MPPQPCIWARRPPWCRCVARYSTGPRYAEHAAAIDGICSSADAIRERPLHFAEADMAAFSSVIDAYRMPKSTESEATERDRVIGAAGRRSGASSTSSTL